ncbi:hypothetical protein J6590_061711 [Homalodisca vitripennis]|nr:hypothetical protein J6590_061711 [Homalodisca vitripennis]
MSLSSSKNLIPREVTYPRLFREEFSDLMFSVEEPVNIYEQLLTQPQSVLSWPPPQVGLDDVPPAVLFMVFCPRNGKKRCAWAGVYHHYGGLSHKFKCRHAPKCTVLSIVTYIILTLQICSTLVRLNADSASKEFVFFVSRSFKKSFKQNFKQRNVNVTLEGISYSFTDKESTPYLLECPVVQPPLQ